MLKLPSIRCPTVILQIIKKLYIEPEAAPADRKGHHQSPKSSQKLSTQPEVQPEVDRKSDPTASEIAIKLYHSLQVIRDLSNCITLLRSTDKKIVSPSPNQESYPSVLGFNQTGSHCSKEISVKLCQS